MGANIEEDDIEPPHERADIVCPGCGADPTDESVRNVVLSDNGYLHGDVLYECEECDHEWRHGVPYGEGDEYDDLVCDACGEYVLVHRISRQGEEYELDVKCPACYHFYRIKRDVEGYRTRVGYPQITGEEPE